MSAASGAARPVRRALIGGGAAVALLAAMALDTEVVRIGSEEDVRADVFSADAWGEAEFPRIQTLVEGRAVPAETLAAAIEADEDAAVAEHGVASGIAPVMSVSFSGEVEEGSSGVFEVDVEGLPEEVLVRVQTGPAINGTELRDATGTVAFGDFTNQIEYQDAGAALNDEMKVQVLADLDREGLTGRTVSVVGAFRLINPKNWLVTPVRMSVR